MALLINQLTVWELGFRWAGFDPDKIYLRIPLPVRDNFRLIIDQIYDSYLHCETLSTAKYLGTYKEEARYHLRYWINSIESCVEGESYDRELLKFARIDRNEFQLWCTRHKVPLPEFWFPVGWGVDYEWPDDTSEDQKSPLVGETVQESRIRLDDRHRIEMACKQIALTLWEKDPQKNIKDIANSNEVQRLGGGENYELETVLEWLGKVDPRDPSKKRGPKRKNNTGSENSDPS
jgi:hypothetical protein